VKLKSLEQDKRQELQRYLDDEEVKVCELFKNDGEWRLSTSDFEGVEPVGVKQKSKAYDLGRSLCRQNSPSLLVVTKVSGEIYDFHLYT